MDITYLGHSCFKLRTPKATVVTDPYHKSVGFSLPSTSADVVTVSHQHDDHNASSQIKASARRQNPFIIDAPGEYEVAGISVFGFPAHHDDTNGTQRGINTIYSIILENLNVVHLGDLGHTLKDSTVEDLGSVDVLLCPVGGHYTIGPKQVSEIVSNLEPSYLIPMHYRTPQHNQDTFKDLVTLEEFLQAMGGEHKKTDKLTLSKTSMPEEMEIIVLTQD